MRDTIDGDVYIRNLGSFIRANERQLARRGKREVAASNFSTNLHSINLPVTRSRTARLTLTPHHLFYLLHRFQDLGLPVGPLTIRLEVVQPVGENPASYVSFLNKPRNTNTVETQSTRSVSSFRSTMSNFSSIFSFKDEEKERLSLEEELKYIYSSFTILPALRLAPDIKAKVIQGFEDFPFDRAVPLIVFKNLTSLELIDLDVRAFYGWNAMAEHIKSLSIKRSELDDPVELMVGLVLDDMDRRQKRTSPPIPSYTTTEATDESAVDQESAANTTLIRVISHDSRRRQSLSIPQHMQSEALQSVRRSRSLSRSGTARVRSDSASSAVSGLSSLTRYNTTPPVSLGDLDWVFLRILSLVDCGISSITNEAMIPLGDTLVSLDLSQNQLVAIPEALSYLTSLMSLNVSYNAISSVHSLTHHPLPAITVLNLRGNLLSSLAGLDKIVSIERLDLRDNQLRDPTELARLTGLPNLGEVWVTGNPFVKTYSSTYRVTIFNIFRNTPGFTSDILLDGTYPGLLEQRELNDRAEETMPSPIVSRSQRGQETDKASTEETDMAGEAKSEFDFDLLPSFTSFNFFKKPGKSSKPGREDGKNQFLSFSTTRSKSNLSDDLRKTATASNTHNESKTTPPSIEVQAPPAIKITSSVARPVKIRHNNKHAKRRVVDLDDSGDDQLSTKTGNSAVSSLKSPSMSPPQGMSESEWYAKGEEYRRRVEALRNDFGNGWLSVLNEEV
ncbi:uncharacterized protein V1516DRAFT_676196 [Lipomyces oligophaga]|uniref:uncharacterized protein n=1 Tax=Lipomyces oligophaga TaxID=45792 RepID=UPI0034CE906E